MDLIFKSQVDYEMMETEGAMAAIDFKGDPGKTKQEPAEDADINVLMKRFGVTDNSEMPNFANPNAIWGDFSEFPTNPIDAMNAIRHANLEFMRLPADIRMEFETPANLYNWMANPRNKEEAIRIGLLEKATPTSAVSPSTGSVKESPVLTSDSKENQNATP